MGLQMLAFPCNQFLNLEPGCNDDIEKFIREDMGAAFPIMEKVEVNGPNTHAVFKHLRCSCE